MNHGKNVLFRRVKNDKNTNGNSKTNQIFDIKEKISMKKIQFNFGFPHCK